MSRRSLAIVAAAALAAASAAEAAVVGTSINVNFTGGASTNPPTPAVSLDPGDVTGVIPSANWTNAVGASGTLSNLVSDVNGVAVPTAASINWNATGTWSTDSENNTSQFLNAADEKLMSGYIDTNDNDPKTITFSGLANGTYDVYVYTLTAVNARDSGNIAVEGVTKKSISLTSTTFVPGGGPGGDDDVGGIPGNFNLYPGVLVTDGNIDISLNAQTFRTAINGIQIVTVVPEPAALSVLAVGGLGLLRRPRR